ncbi:MAG: hypothetical protein RL148_807 [Planctomycetota bacterium]
MNRHAVTTRVAAVWRSRWLTVLFVLAMVAAVTMGIRAGLAEIRDHGTQVRVHFHYLKTTTRDITLYGRALLKTVREDEQKAMLIGPALVHFDCPDVGSAMLELEIEHVSCRISDTVRIEDEATGAVHELNDLVGQRNHVRVPLPKAVTTLRIVPSQGHLGMRIHRFRFLPDVVPEPFSVRAQWQARHEDSHVRVAVGSGFWPYEPTQKDKDRLETDRYAYLRVEPVKPGPHLVKLQFQRPDPTAALPEILLGHEQVWSGIAGRNQRWNRATTEQGVTTLELHLDLAATNVLTLQCPGDFRSQAAMGLGADIRPVALAFRLDSWSIVPRE